jgi:hypothetical protein
MALGRENGTSLPVFTHVLFSRPNCGDRRKGLLRDRCRCDFRELPDMISESAWGDSRMQLVGDKRCCWVRPQPRVCVNPPGPQRLNVGQNTVSSKGLSDRHPSLVRRAETAVRYGINRARGHRDVE